GTCPPAGAGAGRRLSAVPPVIDDQPKRESFGAGMRQAQHQIGDIEITPGESGAGEIRAVAAITVSANRSRTSPAAQSRPRLSTLDALVLALQMAEAYLTHSRSLTGAQRRAGWVRRIDLRAGTAPQEDLGEVPLRARLLHTIEQEGGRAVSAFDCRVGT